MIAAPKVDGLPLTRQWHVVHRAGKTLSPASEAFQAFLLAQGEKFLTRNFFAGIPGLGERRPTHKTTRGSVA